MKKLELKEGYILDLATKKPVDIRKPEEAVRLYWCIKGW